MKHTIIKTAMITIGVFTLIFLFLFAQELNMSPKFAAVLTVVGILLTWFGAMLEEDNRKYSNEELPD